MEFCELVLSCVGHMVRVLLLKALRRFNDSMKLRLNTNLLFDKLSICRGIFKTRITNKSRRKFVNKFWNFSFSYKTFETFIVVIAFFLLSIHEKTKQTWFVTILRKKYLKPTIKYNRTVKFQKKTFPHHNSSKANLSW